MELLLWLSGAYLIYCLFSLIGLRKAGNKSICQVDCAITSAFGFFLLTGFYNKKKITKELFGILCAVYGFIILIYGFLSFLIKAKNKLGKSG